ncbi:MULTISPECIES: agmatine deiminase family protein [Bradyrhizobium]|uniref:Agmatine deiminase n=1 Tax=Bradyrhizobium ottawaense TaxID=931866 RepID=A0ABV4FP79_9BRAD|nr:MULTISPECIES: agmatine deiminase family protein [Bradyrhizobium]MBR1292887.1 agmatine deiminase family protein [Bradyrhizobium ottawaense]WLB46003.1 agmatine deiminase family protein [Bradyrhizobium ottawaense]WQN83285.1 agmatine deiminase family protein [Bradyrhizobium ottawaense]BBO01990.1 porphyromonas-type peptidyl-arginine deiminase [Bradyrhizobium ottawaense]GMO49500.1 agmatine deiminase family protein [Bradyrhizobium ottawaense]
MRETTLRIPADFEPHANTVMSFAVHREWGSDRECVEDELEEVIRAIAEDEPVTLLTPPDLLGAVRSRGLPPEVEIVPAPVDDIWMRDIAPVFAHGPDGIVAIDLNFNGWDNSWRRPSRPGDRLARIFDFGVPVVSASFVGEGGALLSDGRGLAIATRSCLLARNPHLTESDLSAAVAALGLSTVLWLDGDRKEPITSGHPDGHLAFLPDGGLLVETIDHGAGHRGRRRDVIALRRASAEGIVGGLRYIARPGERWREFADNLFAATYVNLFVTRRQVITARFGNPFGDGAAERTLAACFPGRRICMLDLNKILRGGGGVRCLTQPVPA